MPPDPTTTSQRAQTFAVPIACGIALAIVFACAPGERTTSMALATLVALASGLAASAIGVYGGVLVPGLMLVGIDARFAAAASLFLQVVVIPLGVGTHTKLGNVRRAIVVPLVAGGAVGAFAGPFVGQMLPKSAVARVVAGTIVLVGLVVLATQRSARARRAVPVERVPRERIAIVGLVAGFASGVSGAGWGPIGVKLLILLGIEPRQAIGSSLVGRIFMAIAAVVGYFASAAATSSLTVDAWLIGPLLCGSAATLVLGAHVVTRLDRDRAVVVITLLSIALALPTLIRGA